MTRFVVIVILLIGFLPWVEVGADENSPASFSTSTPGSDAFDGEGNTDSDSHNDDPPFLQHNEIRKYLEKYAGLDKLHEEWETLKELRDLGMVYGLQTSILEELKNAAGNGSMTNTCVNDTAQIVADLARGQKYAVQGR